jgi:hypothetical protein
MNIKFSLSSALKNKQCLLFLILGCFITLGYAENNNSSNSPVFNNSNQILHLPHAITQPDNIQYHNVEILLGIDGQYQFVSVGASEANTEPALASTPFYHWDDRILRIPVVVIQPENIRYVNVEVLLGADGIFQILAATNEQQSSNSGTLTDLLEKGDRFDFVLESAGAGSRSAEIWDVINERSVPCWIADNPLFTYQFFLAPPLVVNPPPNTFVSSYRYTGFDVSTGSFIVHSTGIYKRAGSEQGFLAAGVTTWDSGPEFLVVFDNTTIVHTIQHINGTPIITTYKAASRC